MPDLNLRWIPSFDLGDTTIDLTYPVTRWRPGARTVGSVRKSITGVPGPVLRLRQYTLALTLRFTESEWPAVREMIVFGQTGAAFAWEPHDLSSIGATPAAIAVLLDAPRVTDVVRPTRDAAVLRMMTLPIVLVRADGLPWDLEYFRAPAGGAFYSAAFDAAAFATT